MLARKTPPPPKPSAGSAAWQKIRLPAVALIVATCSSAIVALSLDARQRFLRLEQGKSDGIYWQLAQAEVELLTLGDAITAARLSPTTRIADVRRRFDDLSEQIGSLNAASETSAAVLSQPVYADEIGELQEFVDETAPVMSLPDPELADALPVLSAAMGPLQSSARALVLQTKDNRELERQEDRKLIAGTLLRLVVLTVALVVLLSIVVTQLLRLYLRSREQAEESRRTGARLSTIFATSADAILVTDITGIVLDCNRAAEAIFGHSRDVLCGADAMSLLFPAELLASQRAKVTEALQTAAPGDGPLRLELEAQRADGSCFPVETSLAAARMESGDIIVALLRDISARRRGERDLTEARDHALAGEQAKAEFLAVMSHEMRTPLNGLVGSIELLAQTPLTHEQREIVSVLNASADILLDHVNSVLDIARSEARSADTEIAEFDLDRLVEDCVANQAGVATAGGNRVDVHFLSGRIGVVRGNPTRLRQVLLNLLGNAVKFTRNGSIRIETQSVEGSTVEIRVIDSGIGIASVDQERIFEDFVTLDSGYDRRSGGTGLGLGIARRLARMMGGEIGVQSVPGMGSRFVLRLPLQRSQVRTETPDQSAARPPTVAPSLSVLLIEDNDINRFIAQSFLHGAGHRVAATRSGVEGLSAADAEAFDVILTDISMPGLDGFEVARRLRAGSGCSAGSRIVALTAHTLTPEQVSSAGFDGFLQKPVERSALLGALHPAGQAVPPIPPPAGPDPLDPEPLRELQSQIGGAAMLNLIRQLILDGDAIVERLHRTDPPPPLRELVHQLSGAVGTFGARPLHAQLRRISELLHRGEDGTLEVASIPDLWQATRTALLLEAEAIRRAEPAARRSVNE